jgi:hypothetical protein
VRIKAQSTIAQLLGSRVLNLAGEWMFVSRVCCVLCMYGLLRRADNSSRRALRIVYVHVCVCVLRVCVCLIVCDQVQPNPSTPTTGWVEKFRLHIKR